MADYERSLVAAYDMSDINPKNLAPFRAGSYDGVGSGLDPTTDIVEGVAGGRAIEFDGNTEHINCGDIIELNAVEQFTISFWMNQNIIDISDVIFYKFDDANNAIIISTNVDGFFYFQPRNGAAPNGKFDYSTVISANTWHHVTMIYDGSGAGNIDRLKVFVDGVQMTLIFTGVIQATTADLVGIDATIGLNTLSFDGKIDSVRIYQKALTPLQVADLYARTRKGILR